MLALDLRKDFSSNIMVTLSEKAARQGKFICRAQFVHKAIQSAMGANGIFCSSVSAQDN